MAGGEMMRMTRRVRPRTKEEFGLDPRYNGQPLATCTLCGQSVRPAYRDWLMSFTGERCFHSVNPYQPAGLWPGETREAFGYPATLVAEAAQLRAGFADEAVEAMDDRSWAAFREMERKS